MFLFPMFFPILVRVYPRNDFHMQFRRVFLISITRRKQLKSFKSDGHFYFSISVVVTAVWCLVCLYRRDIKDHPFSRILFLLCVFQLR